MSYDKGVREAFNKIERSVGKPNTINADNIIKEAIKSSWVYIAAFTLLIFTISLNKMMFLPTYESSTTILIDYPAKSPTSLEIERLPLKDYVAYVSLQKQLIVSDPILETVIKRLNLLEITDDDPEEEMNNLVKRLRGRHIHVESDYLSALLTIKVIYDDPHKAADIANMLVSVFKEWSVKTNSEETSNLSTYIDRQAAKAKDSLHKSHEKLRKFEKENMISSLEEENSIWLKELTDLQAEHERMKVKEKELLDQLKANMQKVKEYEKQTTTDTIVEQNKYLLTLTSKLISLEVEHQKLSELYTDESPQVTHSKKRIDFLKQKIKKRKESFNNMDKMQVNPLLETLNKDMIILKRTQIEVQSKLQNLPKQIKKIQKTMQLIPDKYLEHDALLRQTQLNEKHYKILIEKQNDVNLLIEKPKVVNIKTINKARVHPKARETMKKVAVYTIISFIFLCGIVVLKIVYNFIKLENSV